MTRYRSTTLREMEVKYRKSAWQRFLSLLGGISALVLVSALIAVVLIEWMAGCGETYVDANGTRHHYQCVFVPFNN